MDEGVQARLRTEFATPFEGKKQIQLDFRYSGRDYTTHFEYEQHRLGHTISLSLLNPCLLLQCDLSSGWTLTDLQKDILRHFDTKGDGQLDATERAAAKAWLEQIIASLDQPAPDKPAPK